VRRQKVCIEHVGANGRVIHGAAALVRSYRLVIVIHADDGALVPQRARGRSISPVFQVTQEIVRPAIGSEIIRRRADGWLLKWNSLAARNGQTKSGVCRQSFSGLVRKDEGVYVVPVVRKQ